MKPLLTASCSQEHLEFETLPIVHPPVDVLQPSEELWEVLWEEPMPWETPDDMVLEEVLGQELLEDAQPCPWSEYFEEKEKLPFDALPDVV